MDDLCARLALEHRFSEQSDDVVALDEVAVFVEQKTAIEVTIPGDAEVGVGAAHEIASRDAVLAQQGTRDAVWKPAVRYGVQTPVRERHMRRVRLSQIGTASCRDVRAYSEFLWEVDDSNKKN